MKQLIIQTRMSLLGAQSNDIEKNWDFHESFNRRVKRTLDIEAWEKTCYVQITIEEHDGELQAMIRVMEVLQDGNILSISNQIGDPDETMRKVYDLISRDQCMIIKDEWPGFAALGWHYAVLIMQGDIEPVIVDNNFTEKQRDQYMKSYRENNGDEDGLYFLNYYGKVDISAPSGLFFEE